MSASTCSFGANKWWRQGRIVFVSSGRCQPKGSSSRAQVLEHLVCMLSSRGRSTDHAVSRHFCCDGHAHSVSAGGVFRFVLIFWGFYLVSDS